MKKIIDYASWGFILLFALPTVLIMASWNSLPGEPMFGVKRAFEQVLLLMVKPSYAAEAKLNVQYTQRRSKEAQVLLASDQSTDGLRYLSQQIQATQAVIERAPNKTTQRDLARQYITTLRTVSSELETQQQGVSGNQPTSTPTQARVPTATPTYRPSTPGQPTPTPSITPEPEPEEEIEDIQEEIEETIEELEDLAPQQEQADMDDDDSGTNQGDTFGDGDDDNDDDRGNSEEHRQDDQKEEEDDKKKDNGNSDNQNNDNGQNQGNND